MPGINGEMTEARWTMRMSKDQKNMLYRQATRLGMSANKYVLNLILSDIKETEKERCHITSVLEMSNEELSEINGGVLKNIYLINFQGISINHKRNYHEKTI